MKRKLLVITSFAAATGLLAAGVQAADDDQYRNAPSSSSQEQAMSLSDFAGSLISEGYTIQEIEAEGGIYSVEMLDGNGLEVEGDYDAVTGEPIRGPRHDD